MYYCFVMGADNVSVSDFSRRPFVMAVGPSAARCKERKKIG
jgi:hypothetical protein